MKYNRVEN